MGEKKYQTFNFFALSCCTTAVATITNTRPSKPRRPRALFSLACLADAPGPRVIAFLRAYPRRTLPSPGVHAGVLALHPKPLPDIKTGCPHRAAPISSFGAAAASPRRRAMLTLAPPPSPPASQRIKSKHTPSPIVLQKNPYNYLHLNPPSL